MVTLQPSRSTAHFPTGSAPILHDFHPLTGQFRDRPLELAFRDSLADRIRRDSRPALILAALIFLMFGLSDYNYLGVSPEFYLLIALRVTVTLSCLLLAQAIRVYKRPLSHPWLLNTAPMIIATGVILIVPLRPDTLPTQLTAAVITVLAFHLFIPNLLPGPLIPSLYLSIGFLAAAWLWADLPLVGVVIFGLLLLMSNLAGWFNSLQLGRLQREQFARLTEERDINQRLMREIHHRESLESRLRLMAQKDDLTGLDNRRHFMEKATQALQAARDRRQPFSICMLDIDYFKRINDTWGHGRGDEVLRRVAHACLDVLRPGDLIGRFGGEEFIVALPGVNVDNAYPIAERLRQRIEALDPEQDLGTPDLSVSITVGIAEVHPDDHHLEATVTRADKALYRGKHNGRNQVVRADEPGRES